MFWKKFLALSSLCLLFTITSAIEEPRERLEDKKRLATVEKEFETKVDAYDEQRDKEKASEEINQLADEKLKLVEKLQRGSLPNSAEWQFYSKELVIADDIARAAQKEDIASLKKRISQSVKEIENTPTGNETALTFIDNPAFQKKVEEVKTELENSSRKQILNKIEAFYLSTKADFIDALWRDKTKSIPLRKELIKIYEQLGKSEAIEKEKIKIFQARLTDSANNIELLEQGLKSVPRTLTAQETKFYKTLFVRELTDAIELLSLLKNEITLSSASGKQELLKSIDQILNTYKAAKYSEELLKNAQEPNYILNLLANNPEVIEKMRKVGLKPFLNESLRRMIKETDIASFDPQKSDLLKSSNYKNATNAAYLASLISGLKIEIEPSSVNNLTNEDAQRQRDVLLALSDIYSQLSSQPYGDYAAPASAWVVVGLGVPIALLTLPISFPILVAMTSYTEGEEKSLSRYYENKAKEFRTHADNLSKKYKLPARKN